jgi:hypothetical protein
MIWNKCEGFERICSNYSRTAGAKYCHNCTKRKYRKAHPERAKLSAASSKSRHSERYLEQARGYYQANKEDRRLTMQLYYYKNRTILLAKLKEKRAAQKKRVAELVQMMHSKRIESGE